MGEFIIAVLIVSVLWVMWDVVKLGLGERQKEERADVISAAPGKERLERYAESFSHLADTFVKMSGKKEHLTEADIKELFHEVRDRVCLSCPQCEQCWHSDYSTTYRKAYGILGAIEEEGEVINEGRKEAILEFCVQGNRFLEMTTEGFQRAKLNLMWSNRLLENRGAVAEQLMETSRIMQKAANTIYDVHKVDAGLYQQLELKLKIHGITVREMWCIDTDKDRKELFLTLRTRRKGRCVSTKEIGNLISDICGQKMIPDEDSRTIVNKEYSTVLFVAEPAYYILNGVAKVTKDGELVSGDNFTLFRKENGQMIMSLSDGMGSGLGACRESETVIELLEQFLHAGFGKESAVRMIHSAMMLQNSGTFSTVDLCVVDLYNGECELLKIGASTTFLRKQDWVETITSTSMPMGIMQDIDYECSKKQLQHGDFIIMVSDGVLDALPAKNAEEILKELILQQATQNAKEMAKAILERVLLYQHFQATDDMTVLVGGVWKS